MLKPVAQRIEIAPLQPAFDALTFARLDQVLEASRALDGWLTAFGAAFIALHSQLVLALAGDWQLGEFVLNSFSHVFPCLKLASVLFDFAPIQPLPVPL